MKIDAPAGTASVPPPPPAQPAKTSSSSASRAKAPPPPPPPPAPADEDDALGGLYELAAQEKQARTSGALDESPRCPKCFNEIPAGGVLCTNCGFDLRTRKQLTVQKGDAPAKPKAGGMFGGGSSGGKKVKDKMAPQGSFLIGIACCAGFAMAGALIWFLIGYFTGYTIGFVAMGVGALAGVGMQIGQKGYSKLGGLVAAGMTFIAIIIANIAIAVALLAHPAGESKHEAKLEEQEQKLDQEEAKYDERVLEEFQQEAAKASRGAAKTNAADEDSGDEEDTSYRRKEIAQRQAALDKVKAMTKEQYDAEVAKLDEKEERRELISLLTEEDLRKRNVSIHQSSYEDHYNDAHNKATQQVSALTRDQVKAQLGPKQAQAEAEMKKRIEDAKADMKAKGYDEESGASAGVKVGLFIIVILLIFGWKTIWFLFLGMFFAYRTAAGAVSG
jgi:hypothetical protein